MKFRTEIEQTRAPWHISHDKPLLMLGSCFTDNIGARLQHALFDVDINPFGTTFNPASIAASLARIYDNTPFEPCELLFQNGRWVSMWHHSSMAFSDKNETLRVINNRLFNAHRQLCEASTLIITWGTAWIFERKRDGMIVNNCHKFPPSEFSRQLLDVKEISDTYLMLLEVLWRKNPNLKVILTVSPVRHLADGLAGNMLSKSTLRLAAEHVCNAAPDNKVIYLPAYETVIDDLRDYRFFAADMVHPSEQAIDYVYDYFINTMTDANTRKAAIDCTNYYKLASHRVMNADEKALLQHSQQVEAARLLLIEKYPYLSKLFE